MVVFSQGENDNGNNYHESQTSLVRRSIEELPDEQMAEAFYM